MVRQYVGARYVPKFADPVAWASGTSYEAMTIVTYNNSSYTSKIPVPATVGNPAGNPDYWALTGNYNAQVEQYRQETETVSNNLTTEITNRKNADTTLQSQINNKANYYISVEKMKEDASLIVGTVCVTLGYYEPNDGGGATYIVREKIATDVDDGGSIHILANDNFVAEMIIGDYVTPEMFGAKGDGVTDDTNVIIKTIKFGKPVSFIGNKTYIVNGLELVDTIIIDIDGKGCTFKSSVECDYIFKMTGSPNGFSGRIHDITFDGNHLAKDLVLNDNCFRKVWYNLTFNNPSEGGSGFHQINRGGGTRLYSINGKQSLPYLDTTFLKIEGPDVNISMVDYQGYHTGLYCSSNCQINQFHGYIFSSDDVRVYEGSKFIHMNGGRLTAMNVYPDTQQLWFYVENVGDYKIIGGEGWHNVDVSEDIITATELKKSYIVFVYDKNGDYLRRFHLNNFTISTPKDFDYFKFCNSTMFFDTTGTQKTFDSTVDYNDWLSKDKSKSLLKVTDDFDMFDGGYEKLMFSQCGEIIYICGCVVFKPDITTVGIDTIRVGAFNDKVDLIFNTRNVAFGALVGTNSNDEDYSSSVKFSYNLNEKTIVIRKLKNVELAGKTVRLMGAIPIRYAD